MYDEADAPPPALDLSQEELRKRLRALPPGFDKNALKPLKMLSRTGRATAKRRKTTEQMSRTAPSEAASRGVRSAAGPEAAEAPPQGGPARRPRPRRRPF